MNSILKKQFLKLISYGFIKSTKVKKQFLDMLENHKKLIYKVAHSYGQNPADRQDLIQEIILQLWKAFPKYDPQYKLSTWAYRIALNVSISFYRKEKKRRQTTSLDTEAFLNIIDPKEENTELEHHIQLLYQFINALSPLNKALMILYLDEKSHQEIASILGISKSNVGTKINRIKIQLKNNFKNIAE